MNYKEFIDSISASKPLQNIDPALLALWYDAKEEWVKAHETAQSINTKTGSWIHAYLHRKEGDSSNANYWYNRAGKNFSDLSLRDEWESIVKELLK